MKKKIIAMAALIVICLSILASGTLAYRVTALPDTSILATGNVEVAFSETVDENGKESADVLINSYDLMPGKSVNGVLQVYNIGPNAAWIRAYIDAYVVVNGEKKSLDATDNSIVTINYNTKDWAYKDGYWYYKTALEGNPADAHAYKTTHLVNSLTMNADVGNEYQGCTIVIEVEAQGVQRRHNGDGDGQTWEDVVGWPQSSLDTGTGTDNTESQEG
jgi:hypothetical protein